MTWNEIRQLHPCLPENSEDWEQHANGGGWKLKQAFVCKNVYLAPTVLVYNGQIYGGIIRGGTIYGGLIRGGTIYGGIIRGGQIYGGIIRGGTIYGGIIYDGTIYGGTIYGGIIHGGIIRGGIIYDGTIYGGIIYGGEIYGGTIRGGIIHRGTIHGGTVCGGTPLVLIGYLPWEVSASAPNTLTIGCETHTLSVWDIKIEELAKQHEVIHLLPKIYFILHFAKDWFADNPDVIQEK